MSPLILSPLILPFGFNCFWQNKLNHTEARRAWVWLDNPGWRPRGRLLFRMRAMSRTRMPARPLFAIDLYAFMTCFYLQLEDCVCRCWAGSHFPTFPPTDRYLRHSQFLAEFTLSESHSFTKADHEARRELFLIRKNCTQPIHRSHSRWKQKRLPGSIRL